MVRKDSNVDERKDPETVSLKSDDGGKRKPSFESLKNEHDMLMVCRSLLIVVTAVLLLIPMPPMMLSVKFLIFMILAYASIYNEKSMDEEAHARKDRSSKWMHVLSYVVLFAVVVLFMFLTVNVSIGYQSMSIELDQANQALESIPRVSLYMPKA